MKKIFKNIKERIDATIMCIRFPFLYPTRLVDGLHFYSYKIQRLLAYLQNHSFMNIFIDVKEFTDELVTNEMQTNQEYKLNKNITYKIENIESGIYNIIEYKNNYRKRLVKQITVTDHLESLPRSEVSSIRGNYLCFNLKKYPYKTIINPSPKLVLYYCNNIEKPKIFRENYSFNIVYNKFLYYLRNFIEWNYENLLQWIFCIPKWSYFDCLEEGWKKSFGIQMCKDIRKSLLKNGGLKALFNYKLLQVKSKFGTLRWYDSESTNEINDIISHYEDISSQVCANCGKPATFVQKGWITYLCENCIDKSNTERYNKIDEKRNDLY